MRMILSTNNKWDTRWLKSGDTFTINFDVKQLVVDWWPDNGYVDLGDGLYVRAEPQSDGSYAYFKTVWARTEQHLRFFCVSNAGHPAPLPDTNLEQFPDPPGMPKPLDFGTITDNETSNGRSWYMDGIIQGTDFHHKILQTKTDTRQQTGYYLLGRREKRTDPVLAIDWRYRN